MALLALFAGIGRPALAQTEPPGSTTKPAFRPGVGWQLDFGLGEGYDDNVIGTSGGGYFTQFDAAVEFVQAREHNSWSLNFQPTVLRFYNSSLSSTVNESVSITDSWQVSRRLTLDLKGSYLHTSDPFASQSSPEAQPISGPAIVSPNSAFIGPESPATAFEGSATLQYQVGHYAWLTLGGNYFGNRESNPGLPNTNSHAFLTSYSKMVRRGQTIGLVYSDQSLNVTNPEEQVPIHSLLLSYSYQWKAGAQIALFGGPQYSLLSANSASAAGPSLTPTGVKQDLLSYSAGATLSMLVTDHNSFQLMASRRVADGAGISGAVVQDLGELRFSRRLNKRLSAYVGGFYSENESLGKLPVAVPNTWGAFNGAAFNFTPHSRIALVVDYSRFDSPHQVPISSSLAPLFTHHRVLIEYRYSFGTLPGRR